jgi:hypothetical protein
LDAAERQVVLDHLHSERFRDKAPAEVYATLLDEDNHPGQQFIHRITRTRPPNLLTGYKLMVCRAVGLV